MSIRHYAGIAIDCDGEDCDATYTDSVSVSLASLQKFAKGDGWSLAADQYPREQFASDLCPACTDRRRDATTNNPPQDEGDDGR